MAGKPTSSEAKAVFAIQALGRGFDVTLDLKLEYCKGFPSGLIDINEEETYELVLPGDITIPNVSKDIKCDKGEHTRYRSDVLDFHQMSERFNQGLCITGKMPLGLFTSMFNFKGPWQLDASSTKSLALDGCFITLYEVRVAKGPLTIREEVKQAVPSTWQPTALARFIEKYGTHIITGVKIGGKDVVYLRQAQSSPLHAAEIQKCLEAISEQRFADATGKTRGGLKGLRKGARKKVADPFASIDRSKLSNNYSNVSYITKDNVEVIFRRKGGTDSVKDHNQWLASVPSAPEVISMSFIPITALLSGVPGNGFLTHAINLYLRYKPPIEELQYFLDFQIPRQWSPGLDVPLGPQKRDSSYPVLQFCLMGPKLYVNTSEVIAERRPVTGIRLYLEGKKLNRLAVHLQCVSGLPKVLEPHWDANLYIGAPVWKTPEEDPRWIEHVQWKSFSHVNTAPVEYVEPYIGDGTGAFIVTGVRLQVSDLRTRNVLLLQLQFSRVPGCSIRRSVWDHMPMSSQKSSFFSQLGFSSSLTSSDQLKPGRFVQNSAVFSRGPSAAIQNSRMLKFVDITEMTKGVQDQPGHWIVTGAKLEVENGRICLRVKYSLLRY